ncbi:DUF3176 domain-containing protein [Aspergillus glaucus CBS 516.65]|uniref:Uncharacterized protein n=1 Tax=Aspergillus glaucus CBS 516.65 TaxID=1160497 RepID=A0A1L9VXU1_ASPGL|nr:hypothetical protein ASPGLDRAFT_42304 [Aspergillus glaucus CBS 516.65]OJJ88722.1 hypothetical protein ASPGLDRAFT_42304 [Aspergillus glaucus CBS 516.65]
MEMTQLRPNRDSSMETEEDISIPPSGDEEEADQIKSSKQIKPLASKINDYWIWEIASYTGSLIAMVAIVFVLLEYNGKSLPDWPYGITINSVLSWISQIFTTCMIGAVTSCLSQFKWIHFNEGDRSLVDMNMYD